MGVVNNEAGGVNSGCGEPVGWIVERHSDQTFPRFFWSKDHASAMVKSVNVSPAATMKPLYATPSSNNEAALREALEAAQKEILSRPLAKGDAHEHDLWLRNKIRAALAAPQPAQSPVPCGERDEP